MKAAAAIALGVGFGAVLLLVSFASKGKAATPPAPDDVPPPPRPPQSDPGDQEVTPKWFCEDVIGGDYDSSNGACALPSGDVVDAWQLLRGEIPGYPGGMPVVPT